MTRFSDSGCDVIIIGSGAAGLSLALRLADTCRITLISKSDAFESATLYAQGGIAAVAHIDDSVDSHIADTLVAGNGLCDSEAVTFTAENAHRCVEWLINNGVLFDKMSDEGMPDYHLTREGGHSHRRIFHCADATGRAVQTTLAARALHHPNITCLANRSVIDVITRTDSTRQRHVAGVEVWNSEGNALEHYHAALVVLATGGAAQVYPYTTNPEIACGDGVAIAWRAGCRVANLEFNQFHPTCLYLPGGQHFLLTEALRGEGAVLTRPDGSRFMPDYDPRVELAPRDVVTRAITAEMQRLNAECMYLDISHRPPDFVRSHFPTLCEKLSTFGYDLTRQPVPVVPAAHYTCGGVMVDRRGRTDLAGLYAIGEVSYTGLHGANRLASNSLLECLVYGWSAAQDISQRLSLNQPKPNTCRAVSQKAPVKADRQGRIAKQRSELQQIMWTHMGIVRTTRQLEQALDYVSQLQQDVEREFTGSHLSSALLELRNLALVARLMVESALSRRESRGLHFTLDHPSSSDSCLQPTILYPDR